MAIKDEALGTPHHPQETKAEMNSSMKLLSLAVVLAVAVSLLTESAHARSKNLQSGAGSPTASCSNSTAYYCAPGQVNENKSCCTALCKEVRARGRLIQREGY